MECIGLDLATKGYSALTTISTAGEIVEEARFRTTRQAVQAFFKGRTPSCICLEVGTTSPWVTRMLEGFGHEVIACNPYRLKIIAASTLKTDRLDAQVLARLGRLGQLDPELLARVTHRTEETQMRRGELRVRATLVSSRTDCVNTARGLARSLGYPLPSCSPETLPKRVRSSQVPDAVKELVTPLLDAIHSLNEQLHAIEKDLEARAEDDPVHQLLRSIPGVGLLTALSFVLCIEDPSRFQRSRDVGPYLGLRPRLRESSLSSHQGHITKTGDGEMRRLLTQAAHALMRSKKDNDLKRWALALEERSSRKNAVTGLARKLGVLMHRLWVSGETYDPHRNRRTQPSPA